MIHWAFRKHFWQASRGAAGVFWWDFLFYFLFGVVITFSTRHAGVLVVFSILVAPAALAKRFFPTTSTQMLQQLGLAWIVGVFGLAVAFVLSYEWDLPSGASIVCTLTGLFFLSLLLRRPKKKFEIRS